MQRIRPKGLLFLIRLIAAIVSCGDGCPVAANRLLLRIKCWHFLEEPAPKGGAWLYGWPWAGEEVVIGSRDPARASAAAEELVQLAPDSSI